MQEDDLLEIDRVTTQFFSVFTNTNGRIPNVKDLKNIFIPQGIILNNTSDTPEIFGLADFISSREKILNEGKLTDFSEREVSQRTNIFGTIAQRSCSYQKSGYLKKEHFEIEGTKTMQFIKIDNVWKMSYVAWSDDK